MKDWKFVRFSEVTVVLIKQPITVPFTRLALQFLSSSRIWTISRSHPASFPRDTSSSILGVCMCHSVKLRMRGVYLHVLIRHNGVVVSTRFIFSSLSYFETRENLGPRKFSVSLNRAHFCPLSYTMDCPAGRKHFPLHTVSVTCIQNWLMHSNGAQKKITFDGSSVTYVWCVLLQT